MGYTIEQRREIANALLADREQAAWEGEHLRFRTGKSAVPPPPEPREPLPLPPLAQSPTTPRAPANLESAVVAERMGAETDDGSLNAFLRQLVRRQATTPQAPDAALARADVPVPGPREDAENEPPKAAKRPEPASEQPSALDRFLDYLGGALAVGRTGPAAEPAPAPAAADEPGAGRTAPAEGTPAASRTQSQSRAPARQPERGGRDKAALTPAPPSAPQPSREPPLLAIPFPAGVAIPPPDAEDSLRRALSDGRLGQGVIEVVGQGTSPALALARARAVAQLLVAVGAPAERVRLRAAGPGDRVELRIRSG